MELENIADRLEGIRTTIWKGKGEVRPLKPGPDCLGGFDLVHEYPSFTKEEEVLSPSTYGKPNYRLRFVPTPDSVHLRIIALENFCLSIGSYLESDRFEELPPHGGIFHRTWVWQDDPRGIRPLRAPNVAIIVRMDLPESETLLQTAFTQVTDDRRDRKVLPAQLEKQARHELSHLLHFQEWNEFFIPAIYNEQHPAGELKV